MSRRKSHEQERFTPPAEVLPHLRCEVGRLRCVCGSVVEYRCEVGGFPWAWIEEHRGCFPMVEVAK